MLAALRGKIIIFLAVCPPNLTHIIAYKAAYEASVLHRDISPGNILIFSKGEQGDSNNQHESTIDGSDNPDHQSLGKSACCRATRILGLEVLY